MMGGWVEDEFWDGGINHCDPNWRKSKIGGDWIIESSKSKYCSRKCACESEEN
jgi:hypothetical protein